MTDLDPRSGSTLIPRNHETGSREGVGPAADPAAREASRERLVEPRVSSLELFFDLVFVFALPQVTAFFASDPTWSGLGRGTMVLASMWWAWVCYSWLTNSVRAEEVGPARFVIFGAMGAMLVASLAVPGAFGADAATFAVAYFAVRVLHVALYTLATRSIRDVQQAVLRLAPGLLAGPVVLVAGALVGGPAHLALWAVALVLDYAAPLLRGVAGLRVHPAHFVERHGLIVLIALGESIVAIGAGAAGLALDTGVVVGALLALALAAGLWWTYFDTVAPAAERHLALRDDRARAFQARDSYSYLHLPLVGGIILLAFGIKKVLPAPWSALSAVPAVALCGGIALHLLAHVAFRLRDDRTLSRPRLVAAVVALALAPLAMWLPGLVSLAILVALFAALGAFEVAEFGEFRREVRAG